MQSHQAATDRPRPTLHRKTYQACIACRTAKLRCDLGSPDAPRDPPCRRCQRTGRECRFVAVYQRRGASKATSHGISSAAEDVVDENTRQEDKHNLTPVPSGATTEVTTAIHEPLNALYNIDPVRRQSYSGADDFRFVRGETLENPRDALRILRAAAEDDRAQVRAAVDPYPTTESGLWMRWTPVRDGLVTAEEAATLLAFYGKHINPCHPIVPSQIFEKNHLSSLFREPILIAAIVGTAARYLDLGESFDESEPSRSRVVQGKVINWLMQRIGHIAMGEMAWRTIGTVEALLILSEWPPRPPFLLDPIVTQNKPGSGQKRENACRVYDDLSWTLIGFAVRIAQELELQDENSYQSMGEPEWIPLRRYNVWVYCLSADRHASVRLGRASLIQAKMSTAWWEAVAVMTRINGDQTFPFPSPRAAWRESRGVAEISHLIGLLQELLYASTHVTDELIKTGRYESTLHRLKPELDSLWRMQAQGSLYSGFEIEGDVFTEEELKEIRWRMEIDYLRLYANAIAMRASQARLLRRFKSKNMGDRVFQANVLRSVEGPFILEAVEAAISLVRCAVTMQQKQILRFCPCRIFLRLIFASVFLMKAVSFGAVSESEPDIVDLQYQLIMSLTASSPDDQHVAAHLASLLSQVFPAMPASSIRLPSGPDPPSSEPGPNPETLLHTFFGAETNAVHITSNLDWNSDVLSGFGYDPTSLVSDIEEMLAGSESWQARP